MAEIKKGSRVKCIDDCFEGCGTLTLDIDELLLPEKDKIYTIRGIKETKGGTGVLLEEIRNKQYSFPSIKKKREPVFDIKRVEPYLE